MNTYTGPVDLDQLLDVDASHKSGGGAYTFLAFPRNSLDEHGLPGDSEVQEFLSLLQQHGIRLGIWSPSFVTHGTSYAAVAVADANVLGETLQLLERTGRIESDVCMKLSERLLGA